MSSFSRRTLIKGAAVAAMAPVLGRAQAAPKRAVVLVYLNGGYNALFGSPQAFVGAGTFGVTSSNIQSMGNNLFIDKPTFGTNLPPAALAHIATVGVNHHLSSHLPAQMSHFVGPNGRSNALILASAMTGGAATTSLPAVVVGAGTPVGSHPMEGAISLQRASDLAPTLDLFGVSGTAGAQPSRRAALAGMRAAKLQSAPQLASSPGSLKSAREAYDGSIAVLGGTAPALALPELQTAYGVAGTAVSSFTHQMMAAEAMIKLGTKVVIANNGGWDTHGDINGTTVRNRMNTVILPGLSKFLERMMAAGSGYEVTVAIFGDFARSLPGSDHASCLAATVIGHRIKVGSTGNVDAQVGMASAPGNAGFWSLLATSGGVAAANNPFGANPHGALLI
ncbi:MAG: DUF1501 domain-containing protein [Myxococcaceae bacterium]|nr:DUF1501 domain-containing protein [Myxococcaceae bacterium]